MTTAPFLPYGRHTINEADIAAVADALRSNALTTGPLVEAFETAFASACGAAHALSCNSGTAALHLATMAAGLVAGQTAIVPSITFVATANAVRMTGADVVFSDVDPDTGLMRAEDLEAALARAAQAGRKVTAALPVHLNGQLCDMPELAAVAGRNGLTLIEDACHALGPADVGACRYSRFACFSTHPVKAVATGEGGVVTTANAEDARTLALLRSHGLVRDEASLLAPELSIGADGPHPWSYEMQVLGWNYRLPDILCALGISQLRRLEEFQARRRQLVAFYDRAFAPLFPRVRPVPHGNTPHGWHLYPILVDFERIGITRDRLMMRLRERGIGSQVHYIPVHRQPYYRVHDPIALPGADAYYARCLSIPFYSTLTDADAGRVVAVIEELVS